MRIEVAESISDFKPADWNALTGGQHACLTHEFLSASEDTRSASAETGWQPRHLGLMDKNGRLIAAMPLYEKSHSWGEFVFDWGWAHAYEQAGLDYYPKLVSAIPFTPATSRRLLTDDPEHQLLLAEAAREIAVAEGFSSVHVLFPEGDELPILESAGMRPRKDCQFHWHNAGYANFDAFLATFSSAKRKKARRDRRHVAEQQITFRRIAGADADDAIWRDVYELISITFLRRGSMPYFTREFFVEVSNRLSDNILIVLAEKAGAPIAAAVFFDTDNVLYGRYWGADANYNALHFETCYYQGIDYCIEHGRSRFEPGTQGEHKISRGFTPVNTWSAHWLAHPEFLSAIDRFLDAEGQQIDRYIDAVNDHLPFKSECDR